jgi:hypothetical protein
MAKRSKTAPAIPAWLVRCEYDYYCQGWEDTYGYFLVYADSFKDSCSKLAKRLKNARHFEDCTVCPPDDEIYSIGSLWGTKRKTK